MTFITDNVITLNEEFAVIILVSRETIFEMANVKMQPLRADGSIVAQ